MSIRFWPHLKGAVYKQYTKDDQGNALVDGAPFVDSVKNVGILVLGILQDKNKPVTFLKKSDISSLKENALIIDVTCDHGLGFEFSEPTEFGDEMICLDAEKDIQYYAVGHSPSYKHAAATEANSEVVLHYLEEVMTGTPGKTIDHATIVKGGKIQEEEIMTFQNREATYPHNVKVSPKVR